MINLFKTIKDWATLSKFNSILFGIISTIVIALPFVLCIFLITYLIKVESLTMILSAVVFVGFIISYILFTKFMNKL